MDNHGDLVPARSSSRISARQQSNIPTSNVVNIQQPYTLNTNKALDNKELACDLPSVTFCLKKGHNFRAWFNTASYELFKEFFYQTLGSQANSKSNQIWYTSLNRKDEKDNSVYNVFKTFYNKKNKDDDKNPKFTISLYNAKSSILVNGKGLTSFIDDYFSPAVTMLTEKFQDIKLINESLKGAIKNAKLLNLTDNLNKNKHLIAISSSLPGSKPNNTDGAATLAQLDDSIESEPKKEYFCPICKQLAGDDTIHCEACSDWFHPNCVNMTLDQIKKIPSNVPFNCTICCDNYKNLGSPAPTRHLAVPIVPSNLSLKTDQNTFLPQSPQRHQIANITAIISNPSECSAEAPIELSSKFTCSATQNKSSIITDCSPIVNGNQTFRSCTTNLFHQSVASIGTTTTTVYSMPTVTTVTSSNTRKAPKQDKQCQEINKLKSYISTLEQKIKDQEHSLHIANMCKSDIQQSNIVPNVPHEDPDSRYMQKIEAIEKRLQLLNDQQLHMSMSNLNTKVDNLHQYIQNIFVPPYRAQYGHPVPQLPVMPPPNRQPMNYMYTPNQFIPPQAQLFLNTPNQPMPPQYIYPHSVPVVIPPPPYHHGNINCQPQTIVNQNTAAQHQRQYQVHQKHQVLSNRTNTQQQIQPTNQLSGGADLSNIHRRPVNNSNSSSVKHQNSQQVQPTRLQQNVNSQTQISVDKISSGNNEQQRPFLVQRSPPQCNRKDWDEGLRTI